MTRTGRKHRFIATIPLMRALSHRSTSHEPDEQEQHEQQIDNEVSLGVTPPSPVRLSDSVLALVCPRCETVLYISRGLLGSLTYSQDVVEALAPGQITWFNPEHTPCHTLMHRITLNENMHDDSTT